MQILKKIGNTICFFLIIFLIFSIIKNYKSVRDGGSVIDEARKEEEKLKNEEEALKKQISEAQSSQFIEKQLRDKLGYAKEGEVVIVLPPPEELKKLAPARIQEEEYVPEANWRKWKDLFF